MFTFRSHDFTWQANGNASFLKKLQRKSTFIRNANLLRKKIILDAQLVLHGCHIYMQEKI